MALEVKLDLIERSTFEADVHGIRYLQAGIASGIVETDPHKLLARIPTLPGVPGVGTPHPIYGQCMVTGYRVTGKDDFGAQFYVVYESPNGFGLQFLIGQWYSFRNSTVREIQSWTDYLNKPIEVRYTPPKDDKRARIQGSTRKRVPCADMTLIGVFFEDVTPEQEAAVDCINSSPWYGKKPATWFCTGCISQPEIFGYTWRKTATFSYNADTWDGFERYIDPHTGQPPLDIDPSALYTADMTNTAQFYVNGATRVRTQKAIDFALPFGDR